jgi:hypothetical protein
MVLRIRVLVVMTALGLWGPAARAQVVTGTILGTVSDSSGSVVPGATITIRHVGTGQTRTVVTDAGGRYRESQLPIGSYEIRAELQGFKAEVRQNLGLTVGAELVVTFALQVGAVEETVLVSGDAPLVQTSSTEVSALVDQRMLQQLPLNARDVQQLATLQPGVQQQRYNSLYGPQIVVSGVRPSHNRFLLNGIDTTGTFSFSPVSAAGILMGVEGLQEFKVLTNDYSAAYGVKQGGVVNMVTKAGSNAFHGSTYHFQRKDVFDARNYFDQGDVPPFNREQFGGSFGGPIVRGKTFFYANYEQFRQRLGLSNLAIVPDVRARQGFLPDPARPGQEINVGVAQAIVPYLSLMPAPNGRTIGGGTAEYFSNPPQSLDERYITVRLDQQLGAKDAVWGVYTGDWSESFSPLLNPNFAEHQDYNKGILSVQEVHTFSPNLVNTTRFGLNRTWYFLRADPTVAIDRSLYFVADPFYAPTSVGQFGQLGVTGLTGLATSTGPRWFQHTTFNVDSDFNYTRGAHAWKFGGSAGRWHDDGAVANPSSRGDVSFQTLRDFLQAKPRQVNIFVPWSDPGRRWRNSILGLYVEDSMRLRPTFTLSAGVRWETMFGPTEADGKVVNLRGGPLDPAPTVGTPYFNQPRDLFAPRVGFNWDAFGNGKTSVRGGGGTFFSQITPALYYTQTGANSPFTTQLLIPNPAFPNPFAGTLPSQALQDFAAIEDNPSVPTIYSYHLGVQREIGHRTSVTVTYIGSQGRHLTRNGVLNTSDENIPNPQILADGSYYWPAGGTRPNPNFGRIAVIHFDANSSYDSVHFVVERRVGQGLAFSSNYTFGRCVDDISDEFNQTSTNAGGRLQYNRDRKSSRGPCAFNSDHALNITTTWDLPGHNLKGLAGGVIGDWRWSTITSLQSGVPFEIFTGFNNSRQNVINSPLGDRPSWAPGCNAQNAVTGDPNQYFKPECFVLPQPGYLGNVESRGMLGPALFTTDWSLTKTFSVGGGKRIEVQAQAFNLTNRTNFSVPSQTTLWQDANTRVASAGRVTRTSTSSRQLQFGARFAF